MASVMVVRSLIVENVLTVRTNPSLMVKERRNRHANIRGVSRYICCLLKFIVWDITSDILYCYPSIKCGICFTEVIILLPLTP